MARPLKQADEKRSVTLGTRFTVAERAYVESQARTAGLDPAEYLRRRVLGHAVPPARGRADAMLLTELNRVGLALSAIGNNVNQIARAINTDRHDGLSWDAVADELRRTQTEVIAILSKLSLNDDS